MAELDYIEFIDLFDRIMWIVLCTFKRRVSDRSTSVVKTVSRLFGLVELLELVRWKPLDLIVCKVEICDVFQIFDLIICEHESEGALRWRFVD